MKRKILTSLLLLTILMLAVPAGIVDAKAAPQAIAFDLSGSWDEEGIDPETGQPLAREEQGLLLIKGPNVMRGYLNRPDETARVMRDGWYVTGDIAMIDQDGFITITDRLSRFSKIGGEMVPHIAIEDILHESINAQDKVLAVTSVPDEKRGEKLVVLYTEAAGDAENLKRILAYSTIPNLWKPASDAYIKIDELPMLGSGKLDLKKLKEIAREALENKR